MPCSLVNAFQRTLLPLSSDLKDGGSKFPRSSVNHLRDYTIS